MDRQRILDNLCLACTAPVLDADAVTTCVRAILDFLVVSENNTNTNCVAVNDFIQIQLLCDPRIEVKIGQLPPWLHQIIQDMGSCLHDAHSHRSIAEAFESTPEQLIRRLRARGTQ